MSVNRLGNQADTERRANLADRLKTRAGIGAQCLVERFAGKASTGHWMAWHDGDVSKIAVLPPMPPEGQPAYWLESWESGHTIEQAIATVESGEFDRMPESVINLFIENPVTGKWE